MSSTFTVHLPRDAAPGDPRALERAEFVRDGFSWGAFLVPAFWFFWHRHWLLAIAALAVTAGLSVGLVALRVQPGAIFAIQVLVHLLVGLEGPSLRRLAYRVRGRPTTGVVIASNEAEAETQSFARWLELGAIPEAAPAVSPVRPAAPARSMGPGPVIGLFPDAEGRR